MKEKQREETGIFILQILESLIRRQMKKKQESEKLIHDCNIF